MFRFLYKNRRDSLQMYGGYHGKQDKKAYI